MLVNENRLNLADARARQYLARQMEQFFFGGKPTSPRATCRRRPEPGDLRL
jgi:Fe-S cluster biosynthesis and repair protein YggX